MKIMFNLKPKKAEFVLRRHFSSGVVISIFQIVVHRFREDSEHVFTNKIKIEDDENAIKLIKMQVKNDTKQDNAIVVVNFNLISEYMKPKIG